MSSGGGGGGAPCQSKASLQVAGRGGEQGAGSGGTVDHAGPEAVAGAAAEHLQQVAGARVAARQGLPGRGAGEQNEVHGGPAAIIITLTIPRRRAPL